MHFREARKRYGPFKLALLPIGAYEPRWFMEPVHMNPDESVRAHLALKAKRSIGMHFGTFRMTIESIDAPLMALEDARRANGLSAAQFGTLDFGKGVTADCNIGLWRTRGEHLPLVGEFAFQVKFKKRADVHDKARERCAKFFVRLQQIGAAWIYLGATKTGMVYRLKGNPPQAHE